jgi:hypothetical protein
LRRSRHPLIQLPFPISPTLRLAQLSAGPRFAEAQPIVLRRFQNLPLLAPNVLIGCAVDLQRLADQSAAGFIDTSSIDHALVVITHYATYPLTDLVRVTLWQAFGVPIFELYLGLDNGLLCSECEAHEGWHLAPGVGPEFLGNGELILHGEGNSGLRTGIKAALDAQPCPCGRPTPRLLEIEPVPQQPNPRYLAASA